MKTPIVSQFKDMPKFKITWWAMGMGLVTILIVPLGILFATSTTPLPIENETLYQSYAIGWGALFLFLFLFTIASLIDSIISLRKGERSWALWLGFIPALITASFWLFLLVGSLVFGI